MIFKIGDKFSEKFHINDKIYQGFIKIFNDNNPLHTNYQFANDKGFKGIVMHGNILNGFISYFIGEKLPTKNVIIHSQEIKYKNAVYLNDELLFNAEVIGVYDSVKAVEFKYHFINHEAKVVSKGKFQIGLLK